MVAGGLRFAGYFMGDDLHRGTPGNPKGLFEDYEINRINEDLMARGLPSLSFPPGTGWAVDVPASATLVVRRSLERRMVAQATKAPFCFKDPRFCYTLPAWRPYLGDPAFVCVFREPARTARSIVRELREPYYSGVDIDYGRAIRVWVSMYERVLEQRKRGGDWVFVHYDQVIDGSAVSAISALVGAEFDASFPDARLQREVRGGDVGRDALRLYAELCSLAGFRPQGTEPGG